MKQIDLVLKEKLKYSYPNVTANAPKPYIYEHKYLKATYGNTTFGYKQSWDQQRQEAIIKTKFSNPSLKVLVLLARCQKTNPKSIHNFKEFSS